MIGRHQYAGDNRNTTIGTQGLRMGRQQHGDNYGETMTLTARQGQSVCYKFAAKSLGGTDLKTISVRLKSERSLQMLSWKNPRMHQHSPIVSFHSSFMSRHFFGFVCLVWCFIICCWHWANSWCVLTSVVLSQALHWMIRKKTEIHVLVKILS